MLYKRISVEGQPLLVEIDPTGSGINGSDVTLERLATTVGSLAKALGRELGSPGEDSPDSEVDVEFGLALGDEDIPTLTLDPARGHFRVRVRVGGQPTIALPKTPL